MSADRLDALAVAVAATWPLFAVGLGFLLLLLGGLCIPSAGKSVLPEANPYAVRPETEALRDAHQRRGGVRK